MRPSLHKQDPLDAESLIGEISILLSEVSEMGASDAAGSLGIDLESPPGSSLAFAEERAGELVGMKQVGGQWVTNPNPQFAITETIRQSVNSKVSRAIDEGWSPQRLAGELQDSFGPGRAKVIARTEIALAHANGTATIYDEAGVEYVEILDGSGCLPKGHKDGAPKPNRSLIGEVQSDKEANGQVWTRDQYKEHLLGHPNCVRSAVAYFPTGEKPPGMGQKPAALPEPPQPAKLPTPAAVIPPKAKTIMMAASQASDLGFKLNATGRNVTYLNAANETVAWGHKLKAKGISLDGASIRISGAAFKKEPGTLGYWDDVEDVVFLRPKITGDPVKKAQHSARNHETRWFSDADPDHIATHEIARQMHARKVVKEGMDFPLGGRFQADTPTGAKNHFDSNSIDYWITEKTTPELHKWMKSHKTKPIAMVELQKKIRNEVSRYAAKPVIGLHPDAMEVVAEMSAGLVAGKKYDPLLAELYRALGGPWEHLL